MIYLLAFPLAGHYLPTLRLASRLKTLDASVPVTVATSACLVDKLVAAASPGVRILGLQDGLEAGQDLIGKSWRFGRMQTGPIVDAFWKAVAADEKISHVVLEFFLAGAIEARPDEIKHVPVSVFYPLSVDATWRGFREAARGGLFGQDVNHANEEACRVGPGWLHEHIAEAAVCAALADEILIDSFEGLEKELWTFLMKKSYLKLSEFQPLSMPVRLVGPLFSPEYLGSPSQPASLSESEQTVHDFLSSKVQATVTYISFGSHAPSNPEQTTEIAKALLSTTCPFIWGLRDTTGLPPTFLSQTQEHGLVLSWAPQHLILSHPSTGAFVTHAGWNSVLEAVGTGTPMVAWPLFGDQTFNAQLVKSKGLGVVVEGAAIDMTDFPHRPERIVPAREIEQAIESIDEGMRNASRAMEKKAVQAARALADQGHVLQRHRQLQRMAPCMSI
ncbi:hypothetical protein HKX48_004192 [Thoreauomyces humboldtii]|nr:hypothetical protein HKX48_004192 [Thoreauomyces humboldtii]